jgi:ATP-dependent Clp protease protease subunit
MTSAHDKPYDVQLYENRIVYLSGDITTATARWVVSHLLVLDAIDHAAEIKLYISSYGGSVYAGLAIYDVMQLIEAPVATFAIGPAFSMAAWLLAAGEPGRRVAMPTARIMLHQGSSGIHGKTDDIRVAAENIVRNERQLDAILARHTGRRPEEISAAMRRDLWLTPEEAQAFGVVDAVVAPRREKISCQMTPSPRVRGT